LKRVEYESVELDKSTGNYLYYYIWYYIW